MKRGKIITGTILLSWILGTAEMSAFQMSIGAPPELNVEKEKVLTKIGDDFENCYLILRWNDGKGIKDLAVSVSFDSSESLTPESLLEKVFTDGRDWRFYKDETGAYCFDLNGDKIRTMAAAEYDHRALDNAGGEWHIVAEHEAIENGDVILAEFNPVSMTAPTQYTKLFYLPPADTPGVWFLEDQAVNLADATYSIPLYINLCGGTFSSISFAYYTDATGKTTNAKVCSMALNSTQAKEGATISTLTTKGEGKVYVRTRLTYKAAGDTKNSYSDYYFIPIEVLPALKPLEAINIHAPQSPLPLSHSYDLTEFIEMVPADATYTGGFTFKSSDTKVAGVSGNKLSTRATEGTTTISVVSKAFTSIKDEAVFNVALVNKVKSIGFINIDPKEDLVIEFDPYKMEYNNTSLLLKIEPENADIPKASLKIVESSVNGKVTFEFGAGNPREYDLVTTYQQNDGAYDLNVWGYGDATIVFVATDGSEVESEPVKIRIVERHQEITDDFQDGTFWLNEDWFGHTNGSINYIDADGNINYRVYNFANQNQDTPRENNTFGCTSQYGMIFGDRLYVMSKQNHDSGDRYLTGGGRLVIADAKTLKRIHSFDVIGADEKRGGDGRACVGVSADKVYIGHHAGIRVLNINNEASIPEEMFKLGKELQFSDGAGDLTPGNPQGALYSNQIGDMVCAAGHVFAVMQDKGLLVIDTEKDEHIRTLGDNFVQAVTQSADGDIWYARNNTVTGVVSLHRVNPETLEETETYELPESAGTINTGWGAWRSANFFASREKNVLYWGNVGSGYQDDILGKGTGCIFRWEIGEELPTEPFFNLGKRPGKDSETFQSPYATMRYDDRHDRILMATTHGASYNYRYNWIYFINGTTGEIEKVQEMKRYFWFPAIPIFPDKYDAEIKLEKIDLSTQGEYEDIDLSAYISDPDNIDRNIRITAEEVADAPVGRSNDGSTPLSIEMKDSKTLRIKSDDSAIHNLKLTAESNGRRVSRIIPVSYGMVSGLSSNFDNSGSIDVKGNSILLNGFGGHYFDVYSTDGSLISRFKAENDRERYTLDNAAGIYILRSDNGQAFKILIK
ncbi:MAG: DUF5074 domain-containing protein [Muribaculaceae bacterium]|nr:DUF5074 domain-containing protein [Muribaculaceae bacterium]